MLSRLVITFLPRSKHLIYNAVEYYSVIKRNEIVSFVKMWINLESVTQ